MHLLQIKMNRRNDDEILRIYTWIQQHTDLRSEICRQCLASKWMTIGKISETMDFSLYGQPFIFISRMLIIIPEKPACEREQEFIFRYRSYFH